MRLVGIYLLGVLLAAVLHLAWHFALPSDHPYSLDWSLYWILPAVGFLAAGMTIARLWPDRAVMTALWVAVLALVVNQGLVPVLSILIDEKRLGYPTDPVWWDGFFVSIAVGLPLLFGAAWLFRPRGTTVGSASAA